MAQCKKGVYIINAARGGIVNEEDLLNSIKSGHCGGAGLDVYAEEPPKNPITLELIKHPKVVATPHLGKVSFNFHWFQKKSYKYIIQFNIMHWKW